MSWTQQWRRPVKYHPPRRLARAALALCIPGLLTRPALAKEEAPSPRDAARPGDRVIDRSSCLLRRCLAKSQQSSKNDNHVDTVRDRRLMTSSGRINTGMSNLRADMERCRPRAIRRIQEDCNNAHEHTYHITHARHPPVCRNIMSVLCSSDHGILVHCLLIMAQVHGSVPSAQTFSPGTQIPRATVLYCRYAARRYFHIIIIVPGTAQHRWQALMVTDT